jgi:hypothetical protein
MTIATRKHKQRAKGTAVVPSDKSHDKPHDKAAVVAALPPALRPIYASVKGHLTNIAAASHHAAIKIIREWYAVGEQVRKIQKGGAKFNGQSIPLLAEAITSELGYTRTQEQLWEAGKVAAVYTLPYIERFVARAQQSGASISYAHVRYLAMLRSKNEEALRRKLEHTVVTQALSAEQLLAEIRARMPKRSSGGRKPLDPRSPQAVLRQLAKYRQEAANRVPGWDRVLFSWVEEAPPEECTKELAAELASSQEEVHALVELYAGIEGKLQVAQKRVGKILARKQELSEDEVEEEDVEEEVDADEGVEEVSARRVKTARKGKKHRAHVGNGKPLSIKERLARAKAKAGR